MTTIKPGDKAPAFSATNEKGEIITLEQFRGRKLVLYFYPKDDTPGCTAQACSLRDHHDHLLAQGYAVLGVSPDSEKKHQKFIDKYELPFSLLADPEARILQDYGVWGLKKFMGREYMGVHRTTFIIDEKGIVSDVIEKVDTKEHAGQILEGKAG
jgi:thioredoxin-dependent peroxiredoxin